MAGNAPGPESFADLFTRELAAIDRTDVKPSVAPSDVSGEPRATKVEGDLFGLALSGGGIRSATFNLGVLQKLHDLDLLRHVDYLSTVSGGGYIGGWWMRWRAREAKRAEDEGTAPDPFPGGGPDGKAVRHLREFSRFLSPRWGLFEVETVSFFVAIIAALLPSLITVAATLLLGVAAFWSLAFLLVPENFGAWAAPAVLVAVTVGLHGGLERTWHGRGKADAGARHPVVYAACALACVAFAVFAHSNSHFSFHPGTAVNLNGSTAGSAVAASASIVPGASERQVVADAPFGRLVLEPSSRPAPSAWSRAPWGVLRPALAWLFPVPFLVLLRLLAGWAARDAHRPPTKRAALDRALGRSLWMAAVWAVLSMVWILGALLFAITRGAEVDPTLAAAGGGGAVGLTGAAAWAWRRIILTPNRPKSGGLVAVIQPILPQVVAYCILVAAAAGAVAAFMLLWAAGSGAVIVAVSVSLLVVLLAALLLQPGEIGLHAAYRTRLARSYLGDEERVVQQRKDDDIPLAELPTMRPLHLTCCTANDLAGDPLVTLNRGARSATLSRLGLAIGDRFRSWPVGAEAERSDLDGLRSPSLAAAITASAAAFNSNMGSLSVGLGPAVTFLLTAFNLRLGLWLPGPAATRAPRLDLPGLLFMRELFSRTEAGSDATGRTRMDPSFVHLSDGGHFENTGLYELVRRQCRYIIVSDCGADGDAGFDDLGNALRRIRQDFGVEIRLSTDGLRPDATLLSRQHVAIGDIAYRDGGHGVLVVLKPTLTGDEPPDVLQYRTRNQSFPHESTGDQFYDEAQWESYRRLGEHVTGSVFSGAARFQALHGSTASETVTGAAFATVRRNWYPAPPELEKNFLDLTERCYAIEAQVRESAPLALVLEVFPELGAVARAAPAGAMGVDEWRVTLQLLLQVTQLMEDTWIACGLDQHWSHPLNQGWMTYFTRWTTAPSFRTWWPVLRPIYNPGFQLFAEERFGLDPRAGDEALREGALVDGVPPQGQAAAAWTGPSGRTAPMDARVFEYVLLLPMADGSRREVQAGIAVVRLQAATRDDSRPCVSWGADDFVVAPALRSAGVGGRFLAALLGHFDARGLDSIIDVNDLRPVAGFRPPVSAGRPERTDLHGDQRSLEKRRADLVHFYARAGFVHRRSAREDVLWRSASPRPAP